MTLVAFVGLVVCTNIAGRHLGQAARVQPRDAARCSRRGIGTSSSRSAPTSHRSSYWGIGFIRIALAFLLCHLIGRAYSATALSWFIKYLGVTPEALEQFDRAFDRAEWFIIPFFAGSNLIAALSGIHRTPLRRLAAAACRSASSDGSSLIWWLARIFEEQLEEFVGWLQRYSWWMVGISVALVLARQHAELPQGRCRLIQLAVWLKSPSAAIPSAPAVSSPRSVRPHPGFSLVGSDLSEITAESLAGKKVVLNIFPSIDTPTCATSVRTFNERAAGLDDTVVLCVSEDLPFAAGRFCGAEGIENVKTGSAFRGSFARGLRRAAARRPARRV